MTEKKKIIISDWDSSFYLKTQRDISEYLDAVFEQNDPELIKHAIDKIARARGMTDVAKQAGVSRQGLYNALSDSGNPSMQIISNILNTFGVRLSVVPITDKKHTTIPAAM